MACKKGAKKLKNIFNRRTDNLSQTTAKNNPAGQLTNVDDFKNAARTDIKNLHKNGYNNKAAERALRRQMDGRVPANAIDDVVDSAKAFARKKV